VTSHKLETLTHTFGRLAAEVIRQLIRRAKLEDFPPSCQLAVDEPHQREIQPGEGG
jgi:hypothetical protein